MAAPAKYMFDMDFSAPDRMRERPATPAEIAQKIAAAESIHRSRQGSQRRSQVYRQQPAQQRDRQEHQ